MMFPTAVVVVLFLSSFHLLEAVEVKKEAQGVFHVPINRKPVPASRLFSFHRRPWFQQLTSSVSTPRLREHVHQLSNKTSSQEWYSNPIHGSITLLGEYYLTLSVGGQPINVQMDTGSSTMAVPLKQCTNCLEGDNRLDLERTTTKSSIISCSSSVCRPSSCSYRCGACSADRACCSKHLESACSFGMSYADKSGIDGALVSADVGISSLTARITFGGILEETPHFEVEEVDGIFGLAYKSLACNPTCVTPLFDALVESGKVARDIFSVCTDTKGGVLSLGGSNPALYEAPLHYVPLMGTDRTSFYLVAIEGTTIGGEDIELPNFTNAIIDSGTTLIIVSFTAYDALKDFFMKKYCNVPGLCVNDGSHEIIRHPHYPHSNLYEGRETVLLGVSGKQGNTRAQTWFQPGYCVNMSKEKLMLLPKITIHLDGYDFELGPEVYMIPHYITQGFIHKLYYCLGIAPLAGLESFPNDVIIGDTVLQKYFVEYDRENGRLGFAVAKSCADATAVEPASMAKTSDSASSSDGGGISSYLRTGVQVILVVVAVILLVSILAGLRNRNGDYQPISSNT